MKIEQATWFFIIVMFMASTIATDYCNIKSCLLKSKNHTLCTYKENELSKECNATRKYTLSNNDKEKIVEVHNSLRKRVASGLEKLGSPGPQPAAKNMKQLKWDNELERIAQTWANQCMFRHDACRDVERFKVGQNIAIKKVWPEREISLESLIKLWYDEVEYYDRADVSKFTNGTSISNNQTIGHYTQLVWGLTREIGCGLSKYREKSLYATLLVCNYGPAGNILTRPVYET